MNYYIYKTPLKFGRGYGISFELGCKRAELELDLILFQPTRVRSS